MKQRLQRVSFLCMAITGPYLNYLAFIQILQKQKPKTTAEPEPSKAVSTTASAKPKPPPETPSPSSQPKKKQTTTPSNSLTSLQQQMQRKLAGAKFRWINELLYTKESREAVKLFSDKPEMFQIVRVKIVMRPNSYVVRFILKSLLPQYHDGFRSQVESWPTNPVDVFIDYLRRKPPTTVVADMGCGEGKVAQTLHKQLKIHSFDLASPNEHVVACDIAKVRSQRRPLHHSASCQPSRKNSLSGTPGTLTKLRRRRNNLLLIPNGNEFHGFRSRSTSNIKTWVKNLFSSTSQEHTANQTHHPPHHLSVESSK